MEVNLFVDDGPLNPCWPCHPLPGLFQGQQEWLWSCSATLAQTLRQSKKGCDISDLRIAGFGHSASAYSNMMQHAGVAARPVANG